MKQQCIEITKANEKPFNFWARDMAKMAEKKDPDAGINNECKRADFKANPIPKSCSVLKIGLNQFLVNLGVNSETK